MVRLIRAMGAEATASFGAFGVTGGLAGDSVHQLAMAEEDKEEENKAANEIAETSDDLAQEAAESGSETDAAADSSNMPSIFFDKNGKDTHNNDKTQQKTVLARHCLNNIYYM